LSSPALDDWYAGLSHRVHYMGVVNVTPDSFSDGGRFMSPDRAYDHAMRLVGEGADLLDIGGESTRPGADAVSADEEMSRTVPLIERLHRATPLPLSIDTYKSEVAEAALRAGATVINDISGASFDLQMLSVAASHGAILVLMHIQGTPKTMQENPSYTDVVAEVGEYLAKAAQRAQQAGVSKLIVDPGLGFGKRLEDNFVLLNRLTEFRMLGLPILVGASRKSFLGRAFAAGPAERLEGTIVSNVLAVQRGATVLRVHDVQAVRRAVEIAGLIESAR
jgi:dihydropteroate synthase